MFLLPDRGLLVHIACCLLPDRGPAAGVRQHQPGPADRPDVAGRVVAVAGRKEQLEGLAAHGEHAGNGERPRACLHREDVFSTH